MSLNRYFLKEIFFLRVLNMMDKKKKKHFTSSTSCSKASYEIKVSKVTSPISCPFTQNPKFTTSPGGNSKSRVIIPELSGIYK